ncbi:hypothetical protein LTR84_011513 [Exophiala bonariae]|uniref:Major facilitator superfamily (MFS) profile domain-containing protein n=1 Tax=Exophiala bonariae TaxID=1690606 RepID=A0AAV9NIS0_9EURO|nr:hypothetical protein LTR84_011513 [Exophiala bonariae]
MGETMTTAAHLEYREANAEVHIKTIILVIAVNVVYFAQLVNVVGSGAYARSISAVVGGEADIVWLTSVISILTVVLSPPVSQATDYWGRKWFLVVLTALGCVGSIVVSRADSMAMAIAGFTVTGLSYGAQPLLHAVTSEVLPRKHRPYAQASVNVSASLGAIFGLLVGGALTRNNHPNGFRTYWYITAAIYAVGAAACGLLYNPPPRELQLSLTLQEKLRKLDWLGYLLLMSGLVLFCLGLSWSQNPYPWTSARVLATFLVGVVLTVALVIHQWRFKSDGMFHHALFRGRNFVLGVFCIFCEGITFFAANNYFAFEVSVFYATDPLTIGLHYTIAFYTFGLFAVVAGLYCWKTKTVRLPIIVAFLSFVIFDILMATSDAHTPEANIWAYPIFLGLGLGFCLTALITAAQFSAPVELIAVASGLLIGVRSLGGSIGLAIYNAIFNNVLSNNLGPKIAAAALPLGLPAESLGPLIGALTAHDNAALAQIPGVNEDIIGAAAGALLDAFGLAFRYVWVAAGCFALLALIASLFITNPTGDFNAHIDAPVEIDTIAEIGGEQGSSDKEIQRSVT